MAGLPPNYNFTNQYDAQFQASLSQMQQQQQQLFQYSQAQQQHLQQHQAHHQQQTLLIQHLHQEARDRRERIRSKPFPTIVTQSVRDRQARGKDDVYRSSDEEKTDDEGEGGRREEEEAQRRRQLDRRRLSNSRKGNRTRLDDRLDDGDDQGGSENDADILRCCRAEEFETRQRRAFAASVLDRPEQLMMYALSTNDSVASQRHRFMTIMCGYDGDGHDHWANHLHRRTTARAAQDRQANMRKAMNIDRRTA